MQEDEPIAGRGRRGFKSEHASRAESGRGGVRESIRGGRKVGPSGRKVGPSGSFP